MQEVYPRGFTVYSIRCVPRGPTRAVCRAVTLFRSTIEPVMQLPDEAISYDYQPLLIPTTEDWNLLAEARRREMLLPSRIKGLTERIMQVRSQVATERDLQNPPPEMKPLDSGFIDLPQKHLDNHRRKGDQSELGRILKMAGTLRDLV